jgi:hypothetical protein
MAAKGRSHGEYLYCQKGHLFTEETTMRYFTERRCRICHNAGERKRARLRRAALKKAQKDI